MGQSSSSPAAPNFSWDAVLNFSPTDIKSLEADFMAVSQSGSAVDLNGFRRILLRAGERYGNPFLQSHSELFSEDQILLRKLFSMFDSNGSGQIDFREVMLGLTFFIHGDDHYQARIAFNTADVDHDGFITEEELTKALWLTVRSSVKMAQISAERSLAKMSIHKPGLVKSALDEARTDTCQAIEQQVKQIFKKYDKDRNGRISFEEFKPSFVESMRQQRSFIMESLAAISQPPPTRTRSDSHPTPAAATATATATATAPAAAPPIPPPSQPATSVPEVGDVPMVTDPAAPAPAAPAPAAPAADIAAAPVPPVPAEVAPAPAPAEVAPADAVPTAASQ
ncbi:hypothetical protein PAPYR_6433 [Paratrimastix pyriformis]|uniref:EF-hand domain-containing protein n=1 Tax=Paratrimastix pyriformis TaxID=342808 RepID=A0ABQ8UF50_9EUKA|nr:hypothetical protein PAPYR_6433 [Paratrimastix pyriformis]